jgi:hypothetical protein
MAYDGDQAYCWMYEKGRVLKTEIETGVSDGQWIEVTNRRVPAIETTPSEAAWTPIDGSEQVILGDLSKLTNGAPARATPSTGETKVARASPHNSASK